MRDLSFLRVVIDEQEVCPYLPGQTARMPLSLPDSRIEPQQLDQLLDLGYRRSGVFFYRTACPNCKACEPLRLDVSTFQQTRSLRRVWNKTNANCEVRLSPPILDQRRVDLFNLHRSQRNLDHGNPPADMADYKSFLLDAPCDSLEISVWHEDRLIAVSITDVGSESLSAVYCFFDPAASTWSPGTFAILSQIELAKRWQRKWVYLGLYVAENRHLNYKGRFRPHARRIDENWVQFD